MQGIFTDPALLQDPEIQVRVHVVEAEMLESAWAQSHRIENLCTAIHAKALAYQVRLETAQCCHIS